MMKTIYDEPKKKKNKKGKKNKKSKGKKYNKKYVQTWTGKVLDAVDVKVDVKSSFDIRITDDSLNHAINTGASLLREIIHKDRNSSNKKIESKK